MGVPICKYSETNTEQIHFYEILPIWNKRNFRQNRVLNAYYAASSGLFGFLTLEDGTDRLSLNVAKDYRYTLLNNPEERSSEFGINYFTKHVTVN